jgi:hypothetical protein
MRQGEAYEPAVGSGARGAGLTPRVRVRRLGVAHGCKTTVAERARIAEGRRARHGFQQRFPTDRGRLLSGAASRLLLHC